LNVSGVLFLGKNDCYSIHCSPGSRYVLSLGIPKVESSTLQLLP
jgi:hypothetical protein